MTYGDVLLRAQFALWTLVVEVFEWIQQAVNFVDGFDESTRRFVMTLMGVLLLPLVL